MPIIKRPPQIHPAFNEAVFTSEDTGLNDYITVQSLAPSPETSTELYRVLSGGRADFNVKGVVSNLFTNKRVPVATTGALTGWITEDMNLKVLYRVANRSFLAINAVRQIGQSLDLYADDTPAVLTKYRKVAGRNVIKTYKGFPVGATVMAKSDQELDMVGAFKFRIAMEPMQYFEFMLDGGTNARAAVDWGDGSEPQIYTFNGHEQPAHQYVEDGFYEISVKAITPMKADFSGDNFDLYDEVFAVLEWGENFTQYIFKDCQRLDTIPTTPVRPGLVSAESMFSGTMVATLPVSFFDLNRETVTSLDRMFFEPHAGVINIPAGFCKDMVNVTTAAHMFAYASVGQVGAEAFSGMIRCTTIRGMFDSASVAGVHATAFANLPSVTDASEMFYSTAITSIPTGLLSGMPALENVAGAFFDCWQLTNVPATTFASNPMIKNFNNTFEDCRALTSISAQIFTNNTEALTFNSTFRNCALSNVSSMLFTNCTKATSFNYAFADNEGITNIPSLTFANCPDVVSFEGTFFDCNIPSLNVNLFNNNSKVNNFKDCFNGNSLTGDTPRTSGIRLWERAGRPGYPATIDGTRCFIGSTGLNEYAQIPSNWK